MLRASRKTYPLQAYCSLDSQDSLSRAWACVSKGQHLMCPKCNRARGILSADIFCEGCVKILPLCKFSEEYQAAWKADATCRFVCTKCEGNKRAQSSQYCAGCKREWLTSAFDDEELTEEVDEANKENTASAVKHKTTAGRTRKHMCAKDATNQKHGSSIVPSCSSD